MWYLWADREGGDRGFRPARKIIRYYVSFEILVRTTLKEQLDPSVRMAFCEVRWWLKCFQDQSYPPSPLTEFPMPAHGTYAWKSSSKIFLLTVPRRYIFCGSYVFFVSCVSHAFVSVHCCLVATCLERADLLALVGDVYCILFLLSHVVSLVRCGTWLYRFLIFAVFLTSIIVHALLSRRDLKPKLESSSPPPPTCTFNKLFIDN